MMEIKFRVWDKENNKMIYPMVEMSITSTGQVHIMNICDNNLIPLFYINRKDKNGKEIYGGDIIKAKLPSRIGDEDEIILPEKELIGDVRIRIVGGTGYIVKKINVLDKNYKQGFPPELMGKFRRIHKNDEIIGNIYENPELLEGGK